MMQTNSVTLGSKEVLAQLRDMQTQLKKSNAEPKEQTSDGTSFLDHLHKEIHDTNKMQIESDKMADDLVTGKSEKIHETMIRSTEAELSFNLLVQVRNKVLEAYQEVMRMQV